jgi:hypothetical protein
MVQQNLSRTADTLEVSEIREKIALEEMDTADTAGVLCGGHSRFVSIAFRCLEGFVLWIPILKASPGRMVGAFFMSPLRIQRAPVLLTGGRVEERGAADAR